MIWIKNLQKKAAAPGVWPRASRSCVVDKGGGRYHSFRVMVNGCFESTQPSQLLA